MIIDSRFRKSDCCGRTASLRKENCTSQRKVLGSGTKVSDLKWAPTSGNDGFKRKYECTWLG